MGNAQCAGRKRNDDKSKQETTTFQSSFTFTLIWLDDEQRKKPELKRCLKEIDRQIIKFDGSDSCETYIRERPTAHFILIVCHKLGNVLVPEIDELPQLDSVFIYDFLSNDVYKSWMKQCQKIINDVFIDMDQLESSIRDHIENSRKIANINPERIDVDHNSITVFSETRLRADTNRSSNSILSNSNTSYYLIWLDPNVNNDELTKNKLKSIIACQLLLFDDVNDCEKYVFGNPNARFVFIVSYELGFVVAPKIASLKQTIAIIVYSRDKINETHRPWIEEYPTKVQLVVEDLAKLQNIIQYEFDKRGLYITESNVSKNDIIMDVLNPTEMATHKLQQEKGNFLWFKLFVKVLLSMKHNERAHRDLVEILRTNDPQSDFVADFAQNYTRDKVIEWFTRDDSCLLKELNKASRQQHLDRLFIFGYLIKDIYEQLKTEHDKQAKDNDKITTLYRSQVISQFELEQLLKANTGELIAINSFMSTWDDRMKAIDFLRKQNLPSLKSVLFEIEVDYRKQSNPFARITVTEDTTLFMLGCIFRIRSIAEDNLLNCYVLKLELCSDDDDDLKSIFDYMTKNFIQPEADLITLGSLLYKMGELDKAQKYFELILTDLDINDPNYAHCYDGLGYIANDQGRLDEALERHKQALDLRMNHGTFYPNHLLIALSHIHLANDYKDKEDYDTALLHVKKARTLIRKQNLQEDQAKVLDQAKVAACHIIEGSILCERGKGIEALDEFQQALDIYKQQGMPNDHPDLALVYQNMGLCHLNPQNGVHNSTLALDYYVQALIIRLKALPVNHRSTGISYRSIGLAYEQLEEYQNALEFYQKANSIHHILNKTCRELQMTEDDLKRIQKLLLDPTFQPTRQFMTQGSYNEVSTEQTQLAQAASTRRIILLGRSSTIKSSFGRVLLALENDSIIDQNSCSMTRSAETSRVIDFRDFHGTMLIIVDTPSLGDRNSSNTINKTEIARSLKLVQPGPHAFVFVVEFTPDSSFSEEDDKQLTESLIDIFGPGIFEYIVFVFTNLESLRAKGMGVDQYMKDHCSQAFKDLMEKCKRRRIPFNNNVPSNIKDASIAVLMLTIDQMLKQNDEKVYTYQSRWEQETSTLTTKMEHRSTIRDPITTSEDNSSSWDTFDKHNLNKKLSHLTKMCHSSNEQISLELAPVFNNDLIGLSLQPYKHFVASCRQTTMHNTPVFLKPISNNSSNIVIACLDVNSSSISSDSPRYKVEKFVDDCACITGLLSITDKYVYFIVSSSVGEYIIPIIHQHRCVERIYIYCSNDNQRNAVLITRFPKIGGFWIDYGTLFRTVFDDIQSILSRSSSWSNVELIDRCYTQTQIKPSSWPSVSLDLPNVEKYSNLNKEIRFVVLHCDNLVLFHMDSQRFHLSQFSDVAKCVEYLESSDIKSLFFIISGEMKSIRHDLKKITALNQIYAIYLFIPSVDQQEFDETLCSYQNIGRVFDNLDFLLTCLISDIKFYLEQPLYRPSLSIFRIKNNKDDNGELRFRDEQNKFAAFQIFISTLREAPASICRNQNLYSRCFTLVEDKSDGEHALGILKTETNKIFDWFIDAPFLSVIINSFCQEQFPQNLLDIQQVLMIIDQHFAKLSPTTSSSVVYRVQLISNEDLKLIKENVKELVAFHAYLLATKDLLTARMIARQAADRGLLIIILQIEIPAQAYVLEVDNNRLMFRFGSIFSIRSIDSGPDGVWYAQLKYTDSDFQSVQKQLQLQTGTQLTWLTLGKCLRTLNHFNEGKFYYDYLVNALPKTHQALPSIFNNMGLMLSESGDDKNAIQCLNTAVNLLNKISPITKRTTERTPLKTLSQSDETKIIIDHCTVYDKMAEVYLHQLEHDKALKCYRMALELATDPLSRVRFEQKIKNILLHPKSSN